MSRQEERVKHFKVYKKRWLVLLITVLVSATINMQWMQYGIIGDVVTFYYGISFEEVNWSSMVFFLVFVALMVPVSYILDKYNLRINMILAALSTCVGAWIKVGSISPDRYWVIVLGQAVVAIACVSSLIIPPKVAAAWFPLHELSTAGGIGIAGVQIGAAIGIVVPPLLITNHARIETIENDLFTIAIGVAIVSTTFAVLVIICFPRTPPSHAAQSDLVHSSCMLQATFKKLFTNRSFLQLVAVFGIDFGVFCALLTMMHQVVVLHHPGGYTEAGLIGVLAVLACGMGLIVAGFVLDKFRCYKGLLLMSQTVIVTAMVCFTYTFEISLYLVYLTVTIIGLFAGILWSGSVEAVIETTYPQPEGISIGILNGSGQCMGIALTCLYQTLFNLTKCDKLANNAMSGFLLLALMVLMYSRIELRRTSANLLKDKDNAGFSKETI
ncbi:uncharacterized MFS-type transporter C09D4.1-like [Photinus pyralis]|nr:uncharacterized MFS-type transporter C09D4.1-like [Photinus pyralis]